MTRASPVAPHEINRQAATMTETSSEEAQRAVARGADRFLTRGRTAMHLYPTEKHFESQSVVNRLEISPHANHQEARKA
jgi:hypothetical protein